ncbi:MAG TPA: branched-chain amino acid transaminase [Thermoanaerobaculia bacterium]|nr:branched-chain amino acid transaminase [Thermoanaerobaculia bacterium]
MAVPKFAFFDGRILPYGEARVGLLTHALNYGTGCFAGVRAFWNVEEEELFIFRARDHFQRFLESARLLSMDLPYTADELVENLVALLRAEGLREDCYIRPLAFLSDETIGVRLDGLTPSVSMVAFPFGKYLDRDEGAHLTVSSWRRIDDGVIPPRGKVTGGYINSALAKHDAQKAGFDDAILLDARGKISEATVSNVFVVRRGQLLTPPVTDGVLEGITRRTVIELAKRELSIDAVERSIDRTELLLAEEAFLAGTGVGIIPIAKVDHRSIGDGATGEITGSIRRLYFDAARGKLAAYRSWCRPVGKSIQRVVVA